MITELSPLLHKVSTEVKPEDLLLQKESWVYFSPEWPDTWDWASGKLFSVKEEPVVVPYAKSYILPDQDYKDLDLSNATNGLKLYPEDEGVLYQCAIGFKLGNYVTHIYVPTNRYVYALGESTMYPDVDDADKLYLGAKKPEDSPAGAPTLFLYFIKDSPAFVLRTYVLRGLDYDKVGFDFAINKCKLEEIKNPTEDMIRKALRVAYYTELSGF